MNPADWMILILVLVLVGAAVYGWKKSSCHGHCASCQAGCKNPAFVEAYRKDHPKP